MVLRKEHRVYLQHTVSTDGQLLIVIINILIRQSRAAPISGFGLVPSSNRDAEFVTPIYLINAYLAGDLERLKKIRLL